MRLYQVEFENGKFVTEESVNVRQIAEDLFTYTVGYFSKILVYNEAITDVDADGKVKLDVWPVGQIAHNIVSIFRKDTTNSKNILVTLKLKELLEKVYVTSSNKKEPLMIHSEMKNDILIEKIPNFSAKIYEVEEGEKLSVKCGGKTLFIIDNTGSTPSFINIG